MTFTSPLFVLFLPLVFLAFFAVPDRSRWLVLLIASYVFYASFYSPSLLVSLASVTLISYAGGRLLSAMRTQNAAILWCCIASCLTVLFVTKYLPHFPGIGRYAFFNTISSIGISYFTFQAISYLVDVYMEMQDPERHLGHFSLYLAFFPKLLQGPIERAHEFLPQLSRPYQFDYNNVRSGLLLFARGLFAKIVVAERLARYVNTVYDNVHTHSGVSLVLATYCYAVQIYCDFAGYTDMARGTAKLFNIELSENFNHPYAANSVADFWRRWHISFSRWIFDYIFKPLQVRWRKWGTAGTVVALLVTFLASGVWHGASLGFVVWGLLHGIYLASGVVYRPYQKTFLAARAWGRSAWYRKIQAFYTFNLVSFAWIFFRANNIGDAIYVIRNVFSPPGWMPAHGASDYVFEQLLLGDKLRNGFALLLMTAVLLLSRREWLSQVQQRPVFVRWPVYFALGYAILMLGVWGNGSHFVYFAF